MQSSTPEPLLLRVNDAAKLLGVGVTKIYDLMRRRELSFVKIGRSTRIELTAIQDFIDRERRGSMPRILARRKHQQWR
jgi:excisionase family DNA binding protein